MKFLDVEIERYRINIIILDLLNVFEIIIDRVIYLILYYFLEIIFFKL